jgi:hypothetical protein
MFEGDPALRMTAESGRLEGFAGVLGAIPPTDRWFRRSIQEGPDKIDHVASAGLGRAHGSPDQIQLCDLLRSGTGIINQAFQQVKHKTGPPSQFLCAAVRKLKPYRAFEGIHSGFERPEPPFEFHGVHALSLSPFMTTRVCDRERKESVIRDP